MNDFEVPETRFHDKDELESIFYWGYTNHLLFTLHAPTYILEYTVDHIKVGKGYMARTFTFL